MNVPAIPAHRRGQCQRIPHDQFERPLILAGGIAGLERHRIFAPLVGRRAGHNTACRVQFQGCRQSLDRESHRTGTGGGNAINKGIARAGSKHQRIVELWSRSGSWRQDDFFFDGSIDCLGHWSGYVKFGIRPVGMVIIDSVAGAGDHQNQGLDACCFQLDGFGFLTAFHRAAVEQQLVVAVNPETDAAFVLCTVIHANPGREPARSAVEMDMQNTVGMASNALFELFSGNRQRLLHNIQVLLCLSITDLHS